jgi:suppressor for copper-sensitivity B
MVGLRKVLGLSMAATALWLGWVLAGQLGILRMTPADQAQGEAIHWQAFDQGKISDLVASGKTVFVDVTADWCLTCKANKSLVLARAPVSTGLNGADVVPMVADWTRPDPAISGYLAKFGRYGIPLNVVYGPKARDGIVLPELLTSDAVIAALRQAQGH